MFDAEPVASRLTDDGLSVTEDDLRTTAPSVRAKALAAFLNKQNVQ